MGLEGTYSAVDPAEGGEGADRAVQQMVEGFTQLARRSPEVWVEQQTSTLERDSNRGDIDEWALKNSARASIRVLDEVRGRVPQEVAQRMEAVIKSILQQG